MAGYNEASYENSVIELFRDELGYEHVYGPNIERDYSSPLYDEVLEASLLRINRGLPYDAIQDALFKIKNYEKWRTGAKKRCIYGLFAEWCACKIF